MFHSCSQRRAVGGQPISPSSHFASSRSHRHLLKPGSGQSPTGSFSRASCFGFSPLSSSPAELHRFRQRSLVVASLKPPGGKGFGKKDVEKKTRPSESSEASSSRAPAGFKEDVPSKPGALLSPAAHEDVPSKSQYRREEVDDDDVVPEVVTNRMLKRIALTVGVPLAFGLLLFPLFYYLKIVSKVDIPEWLPLVVSMVTFGTAGFGITYGVVSSSWDPAREGSLLGWKEAQVNWPLIWDKVQGNQKKK